MKEILVMNTKLYQLFLLVIFYVNFSDQSISLNNFINRNKRKSYQLSANCEKVYSYAKISKFLAFDLID